MNLEFEKYMPQLNGINATHAQKENILRAVWCLMESHVDQAFGVHPLQHAQKAARKSLAEIPKKCIDSNRNKVAKRFNRVSSNKVAI
ncbi:MAG: hypothetical protein ACRBCK_07010 [Alphaproteobacteria bacterium]